MLTCEQLYQRASAYHDGELTREERTAFEQHLEQCRHCEKFYRSLEVTIRRAREALTITPPPDLADEMVRAVRRRLDESA